MSATCKLDGQSLLIDYFLNVESSYSRKRLDIFVVQLMSSRAGNDIYSSIYGALSEIPKNDQLCITKVQILCNYFECDV
ncbi:hypothetical protein C0J52_02593 [Blattella germanica]|nr:hypothetical protein C0J52_02593 [Blattella germanica]